MNWNAISMMTTSKMLQSRTASVIFWYPSFHVSIQKPSGTMDGSSQKLGHRQCAISQLFLSANVPATV